MKIQKLLLLASSMLLLTSCGNKDNSSANEDSEKSEITGETSGDDNQIETLGIGDYFVAEAFEADDSNYQAVASMYIHPSIRFAEDYFEIAYVSNMGTKIKLVYAGSFTYNDKNLILNITATRMNGIEQDLPFDVAASIKGDKFFLQLSAEDAGQKINVAHATLSRATYDFYSINGGYHFTTINEITPMSEEARSEAFKHFAGSQLKVEETTVDFTLLGQDAMAIYHTSILNSTELKLNQIEFRDYDGFELYTQSYSQDVRYGYEIDGETFAFKLTGQYWAIYNAN